jgi:hypothetical protein
MLKNVLAGYALLACGAAAAAGFPELMREYELVSARGRASTKLWIDNDSLLLNRDDGFYSSGLRLTREYALREGGRHTTFGWRIGQELYTASNINLPPARIGPPDHPYAAWLYGGFFKETRHADGRLTAYGIDIGCLGPCAGGEWTQTNLHRLLRQPLPQGWDKQVRTEWGVVLHGQMVPVRWQFAEWLTASPALHMRLGNIYADAGGGITLTAGGRSDIDADRLQGFLRLDGRAVAYNATLQGGMFSDNDPHTVKPKRVVGEAELGVDWAGGPYALRASIVHRTNEIKDLPDSVGAQNFVRLVFSYSP